MANELYQFDQLIYQKGTGRLFDQEFHEVDLLSPSLQPILELLVDKKGELATYDELAACHPSVVANNTVIKSMELLRKKLGAQYFENLRRRGYRLKKLPNTVETTQFEKQQQNQQIAIEDTQTLLTNQTVLAFFNKGNNIIALALLIVTLTTAVSFYFYNQRFTIKEHTQLSWLEGAEYRGLLSFDSQWLFFEHQSSANTAHQLKAQNQETGKIITLSDANEDIDLLGISDTASSLLYHKTDKQNNCTLHQLDFSSLPFQKKKLTDCLPGRKSINAEYAIAENAIYYTDKPQGGKHKIYRYNLDNQQSQIIWAFENSLQGAYRVYPYAAKKLLYLSTQDWKSTEVYTLDLQSNRTEKLISIDEVVISLGMNIKQQQFYYVNPTHNTLNRVNIKDGSIKSTLMPEDVDSELYFHNASQSVIAASKIKKGKRIEKITNPLLVSEFDVLETIQSSASDRLPMRCNDQLYFISNRGRDTYSIWKYIASNQSQHIYDLKLTSSPTAMSMHPSCNGFTYIAKHNIHHIELSPTQVNPVTINLEKPLDLVWLNQDLLIVASKSHLYQYRRTDHSLKKMVELPEATSLIKGDSSVFLSNRNTKQLWEFNPYQDQLDTIDQVPFISKSFRAQHINGGIFYLSDNTQNGQFNYYDLRQNILTNIALPRRFMNGSMISNDNGQTFWLESNKTPQKDIFMLSL